MPLCPTFQTQLSTMPHTQKSPDFSGLLDRVDANRDRQTFLPAVC